MALYTLAILDFVDHCLVKQHFDSIFIHAEHLNMVLTVHHLQRSQSERIVWLVEELGIDYELKIYQRERVSLGAPSNLKAM